MSNVYIVAEIGNTHEGSLGLAKQFVRVAAQCGVDAVKLQTHLFDAESLPSAPNPPYFKDESRKEYFDRTALSMSAYRELKRFAEQDCKVDFFSTPFSLEAVDFLEEVGIDIYKVASGEVSNHPLLERMARTGKKVVLSSGMSSWSELDEAVQVLREAGCEDLTILQCTSEYPCPPDQSGVNILADIKRRYPDAAIGYSDHTLGAAVPILAVAAGATYIEKHFTLSRDMYGSDAKNSTEPADFKRLVDDLRAVEVAMTSRIDKDKKVDSLREMKRVFEKSIVAGRALTKGRPITADDLAYKKPGDGISARHYRKYIGRSLRNDVPKDHLLNDSDFV